MTSEILKRAAEVQAEAKAYFEANGIVVTDPGLVPELIVEIERLRRGLNVAWADRDMHSAARAEAEEVAERLTARAEAMEAETLEQARLLGMGAERELALMAKADRWERMADRLAEAVIGAQQIVLHCEITDGSCCCGEEMVRHSNPINCGHQPIDHGQYQADKWLEGSVDLIAAHAAMKEGR